MAISDKERRRAAAELREASTGAYRHVDALDVIAGSIGVEVAGKFGHEVERETYAALADLIDRPTCRNVYDESKTGACKNGFECSECGGVVEDGEGWLVNGTFNFCPECGASVVMTSD